MAFPAFFAFVGLVWRGCRAVPEDEESGGSAVILRDRGVPVTLIADRGVRLHRLFVFLRLDYGRCVAGMLRGCC